MKPRTAIFLAVVAVVCFNAVLFVWASRREKSRATHPLSNAANLAGVLLHSAEGKQFVGHQLDFFHVSPDGEITATNVAWLSLYRTEGKSFRLSGQLWLSEPAGAPVADLPDGFALFLREWDSLHRYSVTTRSVNVKRRQQGGRRLDRIFQAALFDPPEFGKWIPFSVEASATNLLCTLGNQGAELPGPLDVEGANKIALAPGTRLKALRIEMLD